MRTDGDLHREQEPGFGLDLVQALAFSGLILALGQVAFQIPGMPEARSNLAEIGVILAAFHLRRPWLLVIPALLSGFGTPANGAWKVTVAVHLVGVACAWLAFNWLRARLVHPILLGVAWALFVVVGYYGLTVLPVFVLSNAAGGFVPWVGLDRLYLEILAGPLHFEVAATAAVTAVYLAYLQEQGLRKSAGEGLIRAQARLARLMASAPVGIALVQGQTLDWVNEQFAKLVGWNPDERADQRLEDLFQASKEGPGLAGQLVDAARAGRTFRGDGWLRGPEGALRHVLVHGAAMPEETGEAFALFVLDISERDRYEDRARKSQKMEALGQVVGSVAHDFNNLLHVINLAAESMEDGIARDPALAPKLAMIEQSVEQGARVVRQLLLFSRRQPTEPVSLDLRELLEQLLPILRTAAGRSIEVQARIAPDLPPLVADPGQLEQVVLNLVLNARDAIQAQGDGTGTITLAAEAAGSGVLLTVTDTGIGMDEATQARIFEPYFTTKPEGKGTGLGLATVFGIVSAHGGSIAVESHPGLGSAFRVRWPGR